MITIWDVGGMQVGWGPPQRPLWDGTDYLRSQRTGSGITSLSALARYRSLLCIPPAVRLAV